MGDVLIRGYKYRLYPTRKQVETLEAWQRACHEIQFLCVIQHRIARKNYDPDTKTTRVPSLSLLRRAEPGEWDRPEHTDEISTEYPNRKSQPSEMTVLRQSDPELSAVPRKVMEQIPFVRVPQAVQTAKKERGNGKGYTKIKFKRYPREVGLEFRGHNDGTEMVRRTDRWGWWKLSGAKRSLGEIKVRMHRQIPTDSKVKQAHITHKADGWYISFACEIPKPEPLPETDKIVGVDLNCIHDGDMQRVAATSDGDVYEVPDNLKKSTKRLATLQKLVSPDRSVHDNAKQADPDSNRTKRRRKKIAKLHQTIARQREHHLQYVARMLVERYDTVVFEDLDWKAMRANGGARKKGLNRSMATAAPGKLIELVKEKAQETGRVVVEVPAYNTSQACHTCGTIGEKKDLSVREWQCVACGETHDRDVNAALNIKQRGIKQVQDNG